MRILAIFLVVGFFTFLVDDCLPESKASYVFRQGQPKEYLVEQILNILGDYDFPIASYESANGRIETDFHLVNRKFLPDFTIKYIISIRKEDYGSRIDVTAISREGPKENEWRRERDESKAAWWMIKALVGIVGK